MKTIPLTQGYVAIVDDEDYEQLSAFKWQALVDKHQVYAVRHIRAGKGRTSLLMHRAVFGCNTKVRIDHKDGNGLNNARNNLRPATNAENCRNKKRHTNNLSGFKGVHARASGKYRARIWVNGKNISLGDFLSAEEAHEAYRSAAQQHFQSFARFQ